MTRSLKRLLITVTSLSLFATVSLKATPFVTVQETGIGASEVVNISSSYLGTFNAYAGVLKLLVDGAPTDGFCIDPFHFSSSAPLTFEEVALGSAPKPPGPMGPEAALVVEQLWAHFYSPAITNEQAAALQIAIWEVVDASIPTATFSINSFDYGASAMIAWVNANPGAEAADLIGLTGAGQDYVVQRIPDGGSSVVLLGLSFVGLVGLRRKLRAS
jgi:hypothetical protein